MGNGVSSGATGRRPFSYKDRGVVSPDVSIKTTETSITNSNILTQAVSPSSAAAATGVEGETKIVTTPVKDIIRPSMPLSMTRMSLTERVTDVHCEKGLLRAGQLLKWMDIAACLSAEKCANSSCVTAKVDDLQLLSSICSGQVVIIESMVNCAWNTSCEVGVRVITENLYTGEKKHCCSAYFVFVTLKSPDGSKVIFPDTYPESDQDKARYAMANERKQLRSSQEHKLEQYLRKSSLPISPKSREELSIKLLSDGSISQDSSRVLIPDSYKGEITLTKLVLPHNANHMGNTFGGEIMEWMDEAASIVGARHARKQVVAASLDDVYFLAPSTVGDRITVKARINRTFNTSMEVGVAVEGQTLKGEKKHINKAYFTLVALDSAGKVTTIPEYFPDSSEENIKLWMMAAGRRKLRLERKALSNSTDRSTSDTVWVWDSVLDSELIAKNVESLLTCATSMDTPWTPAPGEKNITAKLWYKEQGDLVSVKVQCIICTPLDVIMKYILDFNNRKLWDKLTEDAATKFVIDDRNDILWQKIIQPGSDKRQDFCLLRSWRIGNGVAVVASHSVVHPSVPPVEGIERSKVLSSGFVIHQLHDRECSVIYIAQLTGKSIHIAVDDVVGSQSMISKTLLTMKNVIEEREMKK